VENAAALLFGEIREIREIRGVIHLCCFKTPRISRIAQI